VDGSVRLGGRAGAAAPGRKVSVAEAARREAFVDPPARRNRVWQADFTTFETTSEGTWRLCPVVDCATKLVLACPLATTQGATGLIFALHSAVESAEALLGRPLVVDCVDACHTSRPTRARNRLWTQQN